MSMVYTTVRGAYDVRSARTLQYWYKLRICVHKMWCCLCYVGMSVNIARLAVPRSGYFCWQRTDRRPYVQFKGRPTTTLAVCHCINDGV